jgi:hypothetical protein
MSCLFLDNFFNGVKNDTSRLNITHHSLPIHRSAIIDEPPITDTGDGGEEALMGTKKMGLEDEIIYRFVQHLISQGIHLVCFDFDMTLVDPVHTQEFYNSYNILRRITPLFYKLGLALLANAINIAIVTFNMNPEIEGAVSQLFQHPIKVYAREDSKLYTGKCWHLDNAIKAFNKRMHISDGVGIRPLNVLFVDDDPMNIEVATRAGYNCINNQHVISLDDLVRYIEKSSSANDEV